MCGSVLESNRCSPPPPPPPQRLACAYMCVRVCVRSGCCRCGCMPTGISGVVLLQAQGDDGGLEQANGRRGYNLTLEGGLPPEQRGMPALAHVKCDTHGSSTRGPHKILHLRFSCITSIPFVTTSGPLDQPQTD
eukprot:GHVU01165850.1.p1 GENE.GHVU01165850.1~~GHVU01165850.1.p1  ORF type:complete len:134 (-),score=1.22 GHVU01165850.1:191-592(-)